MGAANRNRKVSLGDKIVAGLTEFRDALVTGQPIEKRFTVRTVELDLKPRRYDAESVRMTRLGLKVSQAVFARIVGASVDTIEAWEQGQREPTPMACRLLDEINRNREYWLDVLRKSVKEVPAA